MDYYGLFPKFKLNRELNDEEIKHQLKQHQVTKLDGQSVVPDMKVITLNSHYLELVDKYFSAKGFLSLIAAFVFFSASLFYLAVLLDTVPYLRWMFSKNEKSLLIFTLMLIPAILFSFKLLKTEWFAWTHYPVRFDRKNRLVHVFRLNGSTYSVPWDSVFFTTGLSHRKDANKDYYISGHVLADDNETVIDTFCLPATHSDRKQLERHWEFVRRYMEEGPESVIGVVDFCLPIAKKRESYRFGLLYLLSGFNGAPLFLFPFLFVLAIIFSVPRYLAMVTSRVPVWPESIESLCRVVKDDPYRVDASCNPEHLWRNIFRKPSANNRK
ncbi:DUF6708 domain-containing protein [Enterobacter asburiae]|uniref:DUF6708 domain-containing protein n=1 Tax=Enterobacter asburiae TaxID=61645 RepID=UPI002148C8AC|nr:DUF6708 domain-containing protein [Enterobacter asburiae]UUR73820.1 hypothetical protein NQ230_06830 [Enterobacter asburiae]